MTSIAILEAVNTSYVPFNGQQVLTAVAAGVTYVAMRQIVENIGIDWTGQSVKLRKMKDKFNCRDISMVAVDGKLRKLLCIPLKKLNGWLFSINPEKVRADIRDKLIQYQEECFTVLHDYWTKGSAVRPAPETTVDDRTPLRGIVNRIMGKYGLTYQAVYKLVHKEFGVKHIDELTTKQTAEAVEYLASKVIEGEFIGKQELPATVPGDRLNYSFLTVINDGQVAYVRHAQDGECFMSVETSMELARRSGYVVIHCDDLETLAVPELAKRADTARREMHKWAKIAAQ
ncbi:phage antirepressor N-terminal domain-containing protein [Entomohabitans teleogrylli]|uniref:phage antirepressor N-terminal domain-containing protein n=1 Tax=Entomohabitans teleogrylli TaxID=1384589 RepID=UPI00073D82A6|nr:phage antirepressor N-terminal domain-containing protein [Entomohabitans teleogrylli]